MGDSVAGSNSISNRHRYGLAHGLYKLVAFRKYAGLIRYYHCGCGKVIEKGIPYVQLGNRDLIDLPNRKVLRISGDGYLNQRRPTTA